MRAGSNRTTLGLAPAQTSAYGLCSSQRQTQRQIPRRDRFRLKEQGTFLPGDNSGRVQLAPPAGLLHAPTRSGDAIGERRTLRCSLSPPRKRGAEPVGAVIHRPAGRFPAIVDRGKVRARRSRVIARRAPHLARRGQSLGHPGPGPGPGTGRQSIHTGRRSPRTHRADAGDRSSCQPFPQRKPRAPPLAVRLARASQHPVSGGPGPFPQAFPAARRRAPNQGPRHDFRRHTGVHD